MKRNVLFIVFSTLLYSPVFSEDYYDLFGISRDATNKEIRKAFKKLALRLHPDKNKDDPKAHETFTRINKAYEVLKDDELRKKYDLYGEEGLKDNHFTNQYQSWNYFNEEFGLYDEDSEIITLSYSDFQMSVEGSEDMWFINYYSPFCSHCHDLAPTWREVARDLEGVIRIGAVNCQEDWSLCQRQGIQSYPSLVLYPSQHLYYGQRTRDALTKYVMQILDVKVHDLTSDDFDSAISAADQPWLIEFCDTHGDCLHHDQRVKLSAVLDNLVQVGTVDCTANEQLCRHMEHTGEIVYFKGGHVEPGKGTVIHSLDVKEIVDHVLRMTSGPEDIDGNKFTEIRQRLAEDGERPWVLVFDKEKSDNLEVKKLPAFLTDINIGYVDCIKNSDVCNVFHVRKHPVVALLKAEGYEWHYGRFTAHDIAVFAKESASSNVHSLGPDDFPSPVITPSRPFFVDFFAPWCPPCMRLLPEYRKAAKSFAARHIGFGTVDCTIHSNLCHQYNIGSYPTTILYNDSIPHQFSGRHNARDIIDFIENTLKPSVVQLTPETFQSLVLEKNLGETWMVDFYAPWCGPCQELLPDWNKLAKKMIGEAHLGSVDCVAHRSICDSQGIRSYPTIRLYSHTSRGGWDFVVHQGWRDVESLYMWAYRYLPSIVTETPASMFYSTVLTSDGPWLVDFYAPWCGPCMRFAPKYEKAAKLLEGKVKAAKVNCEQDYRLCSEANIQSYPTVRLYLGTPRQGMTQEISGEMEVGTQDPHEIYNIVTAALGGRDEDKQDQLDKRDHESYTADEEDKSRHEEEGDPGADMEDHEDQDQEQFVVGPDEEMVTGVDENDEGYQSADEDAAPRQTPIHDEF